MKRSSSNFWKGICKVYEPVLSNLEWCVGNEEDIHFWTDRWVPTLGPLINIIIRHASSVITNIKVKDLVDENGDWKLDLVEPLLPDYAIRAILGLHPPLKESQPDFLAWGLSIDGEFSLTWLIMQSRPTHLVHNTPFSSETR